MYFYVGQAYNVSCQVLGSKPPAATTVFVGPSQLREVSYSVSIVGYIMTVIELAY